MITNIDFIYTASLQDLQDIFNLCNSETERDRLANIFFEKLSQKGGM